MDKLLAQLDLQEYVSSYENYLARKKPLFLEGDIHLHHKLIRELFNHQSIKLIPELMSLDRSISVMQKSGVLRLEEIYAYVKIINYFSYLKKALLSDGLSKWMEKIVVPENLFDICNYFNDKGEFKDSIDETFESISKSLHHIKEDMRQALRRTMSGQKISTYLVDRQVHYINNQEALLLRGGFNHVIKGSVVGRSSSGFFYVTPENITKLRSKQNDLLAKKEELIYEYCKSISTTFTKSLFFLKFINREFDRFDAYQARVSFAKDREMEFVLPKKSREIKLEKFSHPALSDPKPISLDFSKQVLMITGVNAGGKTMLLKSILSAAFLSKYLLPMHIDSQKSTIGSFKELFAILDDPQNVKNDISTFAGRMTQFAGLFGKHGTLVGVDEIELGTDADEAASLFKVIIEKLIDRDMKIVITTHHKRLASLLATNEQVELLAAIYDEKNQIPTYGFLQGTIGKSYAFETALRYGVPATLVREAREVYGDDKEKLNELIQKNIDLELKMREQSSKLEHELDDIKRLKINLKDEKEQHKDEFDSLKSKMNFEYTKAIKEAKDAIKTKDSKEAHRHLNKAHEYKKATHKPQENMQTPIPLKVGDTIKYSGSRGLLKSIKKNQATIECDGITLRVPLDSLKRSGTMPKKLPKTRVTISKENANSTVVLDLHGQRGVEAVENLDKFISDALINGYEELHIYHGIGTGKLAYAVREFLKIHPSVVSFCDAPPNRGGFGATLVKL
ncbi:MAG TPA: endonuclease MutS2 [Sulfurospirillum arcachonense]|nr:endonuclease MutS2 [Sulfurospirillum arcachonense]